MNLPAIGLTRYTAFQSSISEGLAGIFVDDILDAVPIDKWFEMFKPGAAGEGGFIRVYMSFSEDMPSEPRQSSPTKPMEPAGD